MHPHQQGEGAGRQQNQNDQSDEKQSTARGCGRKLGRRRNLGSSMPVVATVAMAAGPGITVLLAGGLRGVRENLCPGLF